MSRATITFLFASMLSLTGCPDRPQSETCLETGCPVDQSCGEDGFCISADAGTGPPPAALAGLRTSLDIAVVPAFSPDVFDYTVVAPGLTSAFTLTATTASPSVTLNGGVIVPNAPTAPLPLVPGNNVYTIAVSDGPATSTYYTLTVMRAGQPVSRGRTASADPDPGDSFGSSIDISGDLAVVGAPFEEIDNVGAAHIFRRAVDGGWILQATLRPPFASADEQFGVAVAAFGDRVAIGSIGDDSGNLDPDGKPANDDLPDSGAVFVYRQSGTGWVIEATLKAPDAAAGDFFGEELAFDGDHLVVGAPDKDGVGAAYVFERIGSTWRLDRKLRPFLEPGDRFGSSVAISGTLVAIGASGDDSDSKRINMGPFDNSAPDSGAAYVFDNASSNWTEVAYLKPFNTEAGDGFGVVAIDGNSVIVGAAGEDSDGSSKDDNSAEGSGAAYVFDRPGNQWRQAAYLKASNGAAGDGFGGAVAIEQEVLAVGAIGEDSAGGGVGVSGGDDDRLESGASYVFYDFGVWTEQAILKAPNPGVADQFGHELALADGALVVSSLEDGLIGGPNVFLGGAFFTFE